MLKKVGISVLTVLIALVVMFLVIQFMPGDPVDIMANDIMKKESIQYDIAYERAKAILNFDPDKPIFERFIDYSHGIITGNLGNSMAYKKSVISIISEALPWTLLVASLSLFLSFTVGILLGIYIAWKRKKVLNSALIIYQSILGAIPNYVVAYLLVFLFSVTLGWLPARGAYSTSTTMGFNLPFIADVLRHAVLPVLAFFLTTVLTEILMILPESTGPFIPLFLIILHIMHHFRREPLRPLYWKAMILQIKFLQ